MSMSMGSFGLQAIGGLLNYSGQSKAAKAQQSYLNAVYANDVAYRNALVEKQWEDSRRQEEYIKRASDAINTNYFGRVADLTQREIEEMVAAQYKNFEIDRQDQADSATLAVALGEGDFDGVTVDQLMGEVDRQAGEAKTSVDMNLKATQRQIGRQILASRAEAEGQLNAIPIKGFDPIAYPNPPQTVPKPNFLSTLLGIGSAGINSMGQYAQWTGKFKV